MERKNFRKRLLKGCRKLNINALKDEEPFD
jgi:hypothetical protein